MALYTFTSHVYGVWASLYSVGWSNVTSFELGNSIELGDRQGREFVKCVSFSKYTSSQLVSRSICSHEISKKERLFVMMYLISSTEHSQIPCHFSVTSTIHFPPCISITAAPSSSVERESTFIVHLPLSYLALPLPSL